MDSRIQRLANQIVSYACDVKRGENVYIEGLGFSASPLVQALIKKIYEVGANPYYEITEGSIIRALILGCNAEQIDYHFTHLAEKIEKMDVYIAIGSFSNSFDLRNIPVDKMSTFFAAQNKIVKVRQKKRYLVTRFPNIALAQKMSMDTETFEDFYYSICNFDYSKLSLAMDALVSLMKRTDKVRLKAKGTDINFSIKGMDVVKCDGKVNLPDGEVFTAPIKNSVNGHISFSGPSSYQGFTFTDISLFIEDGKIIEASANNKEALNQIFDKDDGSRYIGEFAIGTNPFITRMVDDILLDEKISGSIHLTPGAAYPVADNGNKSSIHWDMVLMMDEAHGGGEIYFDEILIQKDGVFVLESLKALNRENFI